MIDRGTAYLGLSHAAWGYFFLNFDFNLGTVSVIPRFVGYLLLLSAIGKLSGERRELELLRPLCILMALWSGADWLASWIGGNVGGHILFLDLLMEAAGLYFHFQFLTDMAALAETYQGEGDGLAGRLRNCRTVYVVMSTAVALLTGLPPEWSGDWRQYVALLCAVGALIAALLVMFALFALRRMVKSREAEAET